MSVRGRTQAWLCVGVLTGASVVAAVLSEQSTSHQPPIGVPSDTVRASLLSFGQRLGQQGGTIQRIEVTQSTDERAVRYISRGRGSNSPPSERRVWVVEFVGRIVWNAAYAILPYQYKGPDTVVHPAASYIFPVGDTPGSASPAEFSYLTSWVDLSRLGPVTVLNPRPPTGRFGTTR